MLKMPKIQTFPAHLFGDVLILGFYKASICCNFVAVTGKIMNRAVTNYSPSS